MTIVAKQKKQFSFLLLVSVFVLLFVSVFSSETNASINQQLNFQGKIVNLSDGTNLTNGSPACVKAGADTCDFRASIYADPSGGTALWSEIITDVELSEYNGVFNLPIGAHCITSLGGSWTTDGDGASTRCNISGGGVDWGADSSLYLQIDFDTADTSGQNSFAAPESFTRKLLQSVPFAFASEEARNVVNSDSVINFNDVNTGDIAFSDTSNTTLPLGTNSILQALNAASGGGGGLWTINGNVTYLTSSGSDLSLSSTLVSAFSVDESENVVRIGDGSASNGKLDFYSTSGDTGRFEYISDTLTWTGGNFSIGDDLGFIFGNDNDFRITYDEATDDRLEITDGTNVMLALSDQGSTGNVFISGDTDIDGGDLTLGSTSNLAALTLFDGNSNSVTISPSDMSVDYSLILPSDAGLNGEVLTTDGLGNLSWSSIDTDFGLAADSGANQTITSAETLSIFGGNAINTTTGTNSVTIDFDAGANLDITGAWELQDNTALRFGDSADIQASFDGTDRLNFSDGTNTLLSIIDTGTSGRLQLGSNANDILSIGSVGTGANGDLYFGDDLLCDVSASNCGWAAGGSGLFDDAGTISFLKQTSDDFAIGGTTLASVFSIDTDANVVRIGDGANDANNPTLAFYASDATANSNIVVLDGGDFSFDNDILPSTNDIYNLGSNSNRWGGLFLGSSGLNVGTSSSDQGTINYNTTSNIFEFSTDGTTNADISFFTDDLFLDKSTSRVGIGTTSPSQILDVVGNIELSGDIFTSGAAGTSQIGTSSDPFGDIFATEVFLGATTTNVLRTGAAASAPTSDLYFGDEILCDISEPNCGWATASGAGLFTDGGTTTYLTVTTDDLALGGTNSSAPFFFDASTGRLTLNTSGSAGGLVIGNDTNLFDNGTNILRTDDAFEVGGGLTVTGNGVFNNGNLSVTGNAGYDLILDNTTTGSTADSGELSFRGNYFSTIDTEISFAAFLDITTDTDYKLSFLNNAGAEVAMVDESGNFQVDGDFQLGTNANSLLLAGGSGAATTEDLYWGDDLVCDVSETNCGWQAGGSSLFTETGTTIHPLNTVRDFALGGTGLSSAFSVDVDLNTTRLGDGSTSNAILNMFASDGSTGQIEYTTGDRWEFSGGDLLLADDQSLIFGSDADAYFRYDETTNDRLVFGFGVDEFGFIDDVPGETYGSFAFAGTTTLGTGLAGSETALYINPAAGFTGKLIDLDVDGSDIFEVSTTGVRSDVPATFASAGNVSIANNLDFTNSTASNITSESPLYITAGDVVGNEDLILSANNAGYVIVDDRLVVTDMIELGSSPDGLLSTSAQANTPPTDLYWGDKLLCDVSAPNCANNIFSTSASAAFLTDTTLDFAIGGSGLTASFSVDESANLVRIGEGANSNGKLDIFATNGNSVRFEVTNADVLEINNGGFVFNQGGDAVSLIAEGDTDPNLLTVDGASDRVGIGVASPDAFLDIKPATTGSASLNISSSGGVNPVTPVSGDLWWNGTNLNFYDGNASVDLLASGGTGFVQGGNSFGALATLGTNDTFDLAFETDGAERVRIDTSGNVGIGTASPTARLDIDDTDGSGNILSLSSAGTQRMFVENDGDVVVRNSDASPTVLIENTTSNANRFPAIILRNHLNGFGGSPVIMVSNLGGTSSAPLTLGGNRSIGEYRFQGFASGSTQALAAITAVTDTNFSDTDFGTSLRFYTADGTTPSFSSSPRLIITSDGNVGIGTTDPSVQLTLTQNTNNSSIGLANYTGGLLVENRDTSAGSYSAIKLSGYLGDGSYIQNIGNGNNNTDLVFGNYFSSGASSEYMRIENGGNVGIGTTTPAEKLHVAGAIQVDGVETTVTNANVTTSYIKDSIGNIFIYQEEYWDGSAFASTQNYGVGHLALENNSGDFSNGFGSNALRDNSGDDSNGFGYYALQNNSGDFSQGFGYLALQNNSGTRSNGFGSNALRDNSGDNSNGFGFYALQNNSGSNNTAIGHEAGYNTTTLTGANNTFLGANSTYGTATITNATAVGANITLTDSNTVVLGNGADVGIGTTTPLEKLDVSGAIRIGNTTNSNAGTIRWTGTDFEGYDGSNWLSLTSGGSGGIQSYANEAAAGTCNATSEGEQFYDESTNTMKFCDGTTWVELGSGGGSGLEIIADSGEVILNPGQTLSLTHVSDAVYERIVWGYVDSAAYTLSGSNVSSSSQFSGSADDNTVDGDTSTIWGTNNTGSPWTLTYDFGSPTSIDQYAIHYNNDTNLWLSYVYSPDDWEFQGSNNGSTWTTIESQTNQGWSTDTWKTYNLTSPVVYRYYRLNITKTQGNSGFAALHEWELINTNSAGAKQSIDFDAEASYNFGDVNFANDTTETTFTSNRSVTSTFRFYIGVPSSSGATGANGYLYDKHRQDDTTNSTVTNQVVRKGWGWIDSGVASPFPVSETLNYGVTYDDTPILLVSNSGRRLDIGTFGSPSSLQDCDVAGTPVVFSADDVTSSSANVTASHRDDSTNLPSDNALCYTWIAIGSYSAGYGADLAENFISRDMSLEPGEVVAIDENYDITVRKSNGEYDKQAFGIVSTAPGLTLGNEDGTSEDKATLASIEAGEENEKLIAEGRAKVVPVALEGRVPVKVTLENGEIKKGDYLTPASKPGYAMKATEPGVIIGRALEDFNENTPSIVQAGNEGYEEMLQAIERQEEGEEVDMSMFFEEDNNGEGQIMVLVEKGQGFGEGESSVLGQIDEVRAELEQSRQYFYPGIAILTGLMLLHSLYQRIEIRGLKKKMV